MQKLKLEKLQEMHHNFRRRHRGLMPTHFACSVSDFYSLKNDFNFYLAQPSKENGVFRFRDAIILPCITLENGDCYFLIRPSL